ncbi:Lrp/AsnC ligand binding domain-containing protein [Nocardioidaceae bacterium SCSIO 66511]|nr:Lrp/AsnC ligand binding domain-containing protein [Nocardioidaceae bacterium SCSIO 66511]
MNAPIDGLDARIISLFLEEPRIGVLEASRRLGAARATVQSRLDRLAARGVIAGWAPTIDPERLGYPVTAFLTLEIRQDAGHERVSRHLSEIPEVIEACTITGAGDLWCRVVAKSNSDLQRVIDSVVDFESVERTATVIALATQLRHRVAPLVDAAQG